MSKEKRPPDAGDYKVGFGRPPAGKRFVKGRSGNPAGRPKKRDPVIGLNSLLETVEKVGGRKIAMVLDGKQELLPAFEAVVVKTLQQALAGKQDAVRTLVALYTRLEQRRREYPAVESLPDFRDMDPNEASRVYVAFMKGEY